MSHSVINAETQNKTPNAKLTPNAKRRTNAERRTQNAKRVSADCLIVGGPFDDEMLLVGHRGGTIISFIETIS
jgi:hypothetical protein